MNPRELTYGEKAVGLTFNPSNDPKVQEIKELYAKIIDLLRTVNNGPEPISEQHHSLFEIAKMEAMGAQMWAVKAITYQY